MVSERQSEEHFDEAALRALLEEPGLRTTAARLVPMHLPAAFETSVVELNARGLWADCAKAPAL